MKKMKKRDIILMTIWVLHIAIVMLTSLSAWTLIITAIIIYFAIMYGEEIKGSLMTLSLSLSAWQHRLENKRDEQKKILSNLKKK